MLEVTRNFGLREHFRAIPVGVQCKVSLKLYKYHVVRNTASQLRAEGFKFTVQKRRKRKHGREAEEVIVTRLE